MTTFTIDVKQVERLESAANRLRGVLLHLGIIKQNADGLVEPIEAIESCIVDIDVVTEGLGEG